jgi:phosphoenolpyruvate carboxykinase (ATP)
MLDPETRAIRFDDDSLTENTRAAFPLRFIEHAASSGTGGHPNHVVLLTADAFGVLPPVARLTEEQTLYHYLSGYTSKLAGTERGVDEPEATFSACFGSPFLALPPVRYAELLGDRLRQHRPDCWLVNTGWTGGGYGTGERISIRHTRAIIDAVLAGALGDVETVTDPIFGIDVPVRCPGVPDAVLQPRRTWADPDAYDRTAMRLARSFADNFRQYEVAVPPAIAAAGPKWRA